MLERVRGETMSIAICGRCGRRLKDRTSIERGMGPVCWAKWQAERDHGTGMVAYDGPYDGGDIILRRVNGIATANVPHVIKRHSPTGFEWGYEGSGPADLALAILLAVTGNEKLADRLYQQFKRDVIARVPRDGAVIKRVTIEEWIRKHAA